jgi:hypothetical protein
LAINTSFLLTMGQGMPRRTGISADHAFLYRDDTPDLPQADAGFSSRDFRRLQWGIRQGF